MQRILNKIISKTFSSSSLMMPSIQCPDWLISLRVSKWTMVKLSMDMTLR